MKEHRPLGHIAGIDITADRSAGAGAIGLAVLYTLSGLTLFRLRPRQAVVGGLLATVLHFVSELWHQLGHARAAEETGYPMRAINLWGVLGTSIYPADEPPLPGKIHVARALGGPKASLQALVIGGLLALLTRPIGGIGYMITTLFAAENLLVFTLGAFLPLRHPETDGTILLRHRPGRRNRIVIQE
jgi:Zn-dependent protease